MASETTRRQLGTVALTGSVLVAGIVAIYLIRHATKLEDVIGRAGLAGPLISIALQTFFGISPIPTEPLTLINGAVFGPLKGGLISWVGYMLASWIEFAWSVRQKPASGGVTYSLSNQSFRDGTQMIVRVMNPSLWLMMTNR